MRCIEADRLISIRVDGERMPTEKAYRLDAHLRECAACRDHLAEEAHRCAMVKKVLDGGAKDEGLLAETILRAARERQGERKVIIRPFLRIASSLAALFLVGITLRFALISPVAEDRVPRPENFSPSVMEQDSWKLDGVDYRDGEPLQHGVRTQKWIYRFPGREPSGPKLYLEGERVDTLYQPVTWIYH